eukprot:UN05626
MFSSRSPTFYKIVPKLRKFPRVSYHFTPRPLLKRFWYSFGFT